MIGSENEIGENNERPAHSTGKSNNPSSSNGGSYNSKSSFTNGSSGDSYSQRAQGDKYTERPKAGAMEVTVEHNIEKAMKILKRKLIKEGLFKELKARRYYEKPSERKKRKSKESHKKIRKEESRNRKNIVFA